MNMFTQFKLESLIKRLPNSQWDWSSKRSMRLSEVRVEGLFRSFLAFLPAYLSSSSSSRSAFENGGCLPERKRNRSTSRSLAVKRRRRQALNEERVGKGRIRRTNECRRRGMGKKLVRMRIRNANRNCAARARGNTRLPA